MFGPSVVTTRLELVKFSEVWLLDLVSQSLANWSLRHELNIERNVHWTLHHDTTGYFLMEKHYLCPSYLPEVPPCTFVSWRKLLAICASHTIKYYIEHFILPPPLVKCHPVHFIPTSQKCHLVHFSHDQNCRQFTCSVTYNLDTSKLPGEMTLCIFHSYPPKICFFCRAPSQNSATDQTVM